MGRHLLGLCRGKVCEKLFFFNYSSSFLLIEDVEFLSTEIDVQHPKVNMYICFVSLYCVPSDNIVQIRMCYACL
jgi:hypothetical protein